MVNHDNREFHDHVEHFLKGMMDLLQLSHKMTVNSREVGNIAINLMVLDHELDAYLRVGGERAEEVYTDYYAAKAVAYALANKAREGRQYLDKARQRRQGGNFDEWAQEYYPSK